MIALENVLTTPTERWANSYFNDGSTSPELSVMVSKIKECDTGQIYIGGGITYTSVAYSTLFAVYASSGDSRISRTIAAQVTSDFDCDASAIYVSETEI